MGLSPRIMKNKPQIRKWDWINLKSICIPKRNPQGKARIILKISSVQLLSHVWLFATPWTAACQASPSITNSWSLLKLMSIELVMPSNHLILCCPLLFPLSIFLSIRVFSNKSALCSLTTFLFCFFVFLLYYFLYILLQRHYFVNKGPSSQGYGFPSGHAQMWELDYKESWAPKNWCFWTVVLEKTLESPLDCKRIQPVHPKGNQSWIFIGKTDAESPILWPPDAKSWLIWKDPDAGKDWKWEEKGTTEHKVVG